MCNTIIEYKRYDNLSVIFVTFYNQRSKSNKDLQDLANGVEMITEKFGKNVIQGVFVINVALKKKITKLQNVNKHRYL